MKRLTKFQSYLEEKGYSESTVRNTMVEVELYRKWMKGQNRNIQRASYNDAIAYVKHLRKRHLKPQTINFYVLSIRHYYNHLKARKNPFQGIHIKGVKKTAIVNTLSPEILEHLYINFPVENNILKRNKVILGLYCFQGLYATEVDTLKLNDLNLSKGIITIPASKKRGKRVLKLQAIQLLDFVEYMKEIRPELLTQTLNENTRDSLVIRMNKKQDLINVRVQIDRRLKKLSKEYQNILHLRTSVIVNLLKTENVRVAMYLSGIKNVTSVLRYKDSNVSELKTAILDKHPMG